MAQDEEPGEFTKLLRHFLREMGWRMVAALGLIAFLFFTGLTNSLIKLSGRDVASVDFPAGPVAGGLCALALMITIAVIKLRGRD